MSDVSTKVLAFRLIDLLNRLILNQTQQTQTFRKLEADQMHYDIMYI